MGNARARSMRPGGRAGLESDGNTGSLPPMRAVPLVPRLHVFVCTNRRPAGAALGPGCGDAGERLFDALKDEVGSRGAFRDVWVTATQCLGVCPERGATVAVYPRQAIFTEVVPTDAPALYASEAARAAEAGSASEAMLAEMETLQRDKVLALARRLKPGLTLEDVQNPHDFPELEDADWHFEDGILVGIQTALTALRARNKGG